MRVLAYMVVLALAFTMPLWVFVIAAALYFARWSGGELLVIAVCVDALFGSHGTFSGLLYTAITGGLYLFAAAIKPQLRIYQDLI
ncbi:hypothetical protein GW943_00550 [Candidatus Parcubacteria bacterium]|uniref:Uncharacterized protein n=1 Tax=Candidatus Kaiserbacteria bacterium CG10_big_fil_rev_8_21_14_0_10_47_16 TaxID=1974608 RepID=A0A2H0UD29_9BACT|nr:hypothetical protein [Candidatus Parcubacteria bacterium]PIR84333.1 MAG: hypothetical protein COU16_01930 [Candidatus Kaiserbacteria bacterium CG10_big_fil_rev_8_21_14_0_10_47_16]